METIHRFSAKLDQETYPGYKTAISKYLRGYDSSNTKKDSLLEYFNKLGEGDVCEILDSASKQHFTFAPTRFLPKNDNNMIQNSHFFSFFLSFFVNCL